MKNIQQIDKLILSQKIQKPTSKTCIKCGENKDVSFYGKSNASHIKDGLRRECKQCRSAYRKKAYKESSEQQIKVRTRAKQWRLNNLERYKENQDRYRTENKESLKIKKSQYQKLNWEVRYKYMKEWREKNKERVRFRNKTNLQKYRTSLADWYIKHIFIRKTNLKPSDVTDNIIQAKREQIKVIRLIKQLSNEK